MTDVQSPTNIGDVMLYSIIAGFTLTTFIMIFTLRPTWIQTNWWFFLFIGISYVVCLGTTLMAQSSRCSGKINLGAGALGSLWAVGYILSAYAFVQLEFIRSLVESCWYDEDLETVKALETEYPMAKYYTIAYYVFFFTMIGQVQGGGMSIKCS